VLPIFEPFRFSSRSCCSTGRLMRSSMPCHGMVIAAGATAAAATDPRLAPRHRDRCDWRCESRYWRRDHRDLQGITVTSAGKAVISNVTTVICCLACRDWHCARRNPMPGRPSLSRWALGLAQPVAASALVPLALELLACATDSDRGRVRHGRLHTPRLSRSQLPCCRFAI
jgi:hypothetical protein